MEVAGTLSRSTINNSGSISTSTLTTTGPSTLGNVNCKSIDCTTLNVNAIGSYRYVIGTSNGIYYSADTVNWKSAAWSNPSYYLTSCNCITYGNGYYVAGGLGNNNNVNIFYSTDGITWTKTTWTGFGFSIYGQCFGVYFDGRNFIAGGFGGTYAYCYTTNGDPTGS